MRAKELRDRFDGLQGWEVKTADLLGMIGDIILYLEYPPSPFDDVGDDSKTSKARAAARLSGLRESIYNEFQQRPKARTEWRDVIALELKRRISLLGFQLVAQDASAITPYDYQELASGVLNALFGEVECVHCGSNIVTIKDDSVWCNACHVGVASAEQSPPLFERPQDNLPVNHQRDAPLHSGLSEEPKLCTTSGEPVDKVRAEQTEETGQHKSYIVLCPDERAKGFVRPLRRSYIHVGIGGHEIDPNDVSKHGRTGNACGAETTMGLALSETYARQPDFYGKTFCCGCNAHLPVDEFRWAEDGEVLGS